jgi:hypothetical protein
MAVRATSNAGSRPRVFFKTGRGCLTGEALSTPGYGTWCARCCNYIASKEVSKFTACVRIAFRERRIVATDLLDRSARATLSMLGLRLRVLPGLVEAWMTSIR